MDPSPDTGNIILAAPPMDHSLPTSTVLSPQTQTKVATKSNPPPIDPSKPLGVSLALLKSLLDQSIKELGEGATTSDVCHKITNPASASLKCAYIDLFKGKNDPTTAPNNNIPLVSNATLFVSHAWSYPFKSLVDALESFSNKREETNTTHYFWLDMFVVNQHEKSSIQGFEEWREVFKQPIISIGRVLLVLTPWNDPIALTRGWCLFEIMTTLELKDHGVQFDIQLDPNQLTLFRQELCYC